MSTDIEKTMTTTTVAVSDTSSPPASPNPNDTTSTPTSPNPDTKRYSQLEQFQVLVGDIDAHAPPTHDHNAWDLYQQISHAERQASRMFWISGIIFYILIAMQIIFCLVITIGAQLKTGSTAWLSNANISILAGANTGVAAGIALLKGLGLPDKKGVQRMQHQRILQRIRLTTKKLKLGFDIDAAKELDDIVKITNDLEDAAHISAVDIEGGAKAAEALFHQPEKK